MRKVKIIVNPYAGRWQAKERIPEVEAAFAKYKVDYDLVVSPQIGKGIPLAQEAALSNYDTVVTVGGDGTYNETVNGLVIASGDQPTVPMGIIPLGTANDLAFGLGIPNEIDEAVRVIAQGKTRQIDVGKVNGRYFGNNAAIGMEPLITIENERLVYIKGIIRYLISALIVIARRPWWEVEIEWPEGNYKGTALLVSVGNNTRTGGVFFMSPKARLDDNLLDVCFAPRMSRLRLLKLLPTTFNGSHINQESVSYLQTTKVSIRTNRPTPIQTDGEVFELGTTEVKYELVPRKLTVIVPSEKSPDTNRQTSID
ncbi:MAG: diacylglycerol kinase family protein [Chloroflexota bacterium]